MAHLIEIYITAAVPDGAESDLGHEAVYVTRDPVHALAVQLQDLGLVDVAHTRRLINTKRSGRKVGEKPQVVKPAA